MPNYPMPVTDTVGPSVAAAANNAANTTAATDYTFAWVSAINHLMLQNNTGAVLQWELNGATSGGSATLATGQTLFLDVPITSLHLLTAANQNVNGANANNIVVKGWA